MWGTVKSLRRHERELIFDYCFDLLDDAAQTKEAQELLKNSSGAAQFHQRLHACLKPLDHYSVENCPCHLCERAIHRLMAAARLSSDGQRNSVWSTGEIVMVLCTAMLQGSFV
jgi:hypothetical protein